jgi:hypothetical protein
MAERTILVCDVCGAPAVESVRMTVRSRSLQKDLCEAHLAEVMAGAHPLKRGRRAGSGASSKNTGATTTRRRSRSPASKASRKSSRTKRRRAGAAATEAATAGSTRSTKTPDEVATEIKKLRDGGMTYRQIGDELSRRGMKPTRADRWNPVVIGRILKRAA